jgi:glycosyltransferase involved in cell wall biosynthesis
MRVLFLMLAFPDMEKSFNMYTTIVKQFADNGHDVLVLAPTGNELPTRLVKEAGVDVIRVNTLPVKNVPNFVKGFSNLLLPFQYGKALKKFKPHAEFDLIVSPTPPITLVQVITKLKKKFNCPFYLILRDIFPQNAVDLGFMKKGGLIYNYFKKQEEKLYALADHIGCMSDANIDYVIKHNPELDKSKLHELKNFQILYDLQSKPSDNIRKKHNLEGKFLVVFGGNMGKPQQLENVLALAKYCSKYPEVVFCLFGEGVQMKNLQKLAEQQGISNLVIQGTISKNEYQHFLSSCDVGLISLHKDFTIPNIPSKTLDYFNVGIPVLASLDAATDYGMILDNSNSGLWSLAGNHDEFANNFDKLYQNAELRKEMGANGRKYFEQNLTPEIAYQIVFGRVNY